MLNQEKKIILKTEKKFSGIHSICTPIRTSFYLKINNLYSLKERLSEGMSYENQFFTHRQLHVHHN